MPTNLRVGIVGIGSHFRETLLPSLISQENVVLTAFCDTSAQARQWITSRLAHVYVTDSVHDANFWNCIECVVCCSWPHVHEQVLTQAITKNIHCFCEKPVSGSTAALDAILQIEKSKELVIRVGHVFRYTEGGSAFIKLLSKGVLGLSLTYLGSGPRGSRWNLNSRKSFALTHLTHAIDFVTAAAGDVVKVHSVGWCKHQGESETVSVNLRTKKCPLVSLLATNAAPHFTFKGMACIDDGSVVNLLSLKRLETMDALGRGTSLSERDLGTRPQNDGFMSELKAFFDEIRGGELCYLPDLVHARHVLSVVEEIEGRG